MKREQATEGDEEEKAERPPRRRRENEDEQRERSHEKAPSEDEDAAMPATRAWEELMGIERLSLEAETAMEVAIDEATGVDLVYVRKLVDDFKVYRQMKLSERAEEAEILQKLWDNSRLDAATMEAVQDELLLWACDDHAKVVKQTFWEVSDLDGLGTFADPAPKREYSMIPLDRDSEETELVRLLVFAGAHVNVVEKRHKRTPLHLSSRSGYAPIVEILLNGDADVNAADKSGRTALHYAATGAVAEALLSAGSSPTTLDRDGWHPLHLACFNLRAGVVSTLLEGGSTTDFEGQSGYNALHSLLYGVWRQGCSEQALKVMQTLVQYGSELDTRCNQIADQVTDWPRSLHEQPADSSNTRWRREAPAIRVCFEQWVQEHALGHALTEVPVEEVRRGVDATKTYLAEIATSDRSAFRRRISVVGPSTWGKTSLIKSLTTHKPSLVHVDDRTIGIDQFLLEFEEQLQQPNATRRHEVTFWDFAGQDAYQATHSLFFSARTLFVVCIDLECLVLALMQAQLMTSTEADALRWMNDFFDTKILKWVRVICARQPDAEFVFVATKKDRVRSADLDGADGALSDLRMYLEDVKVIIDEMRNESDMIGRGEFSMDRLPITYLGDPRLAAMKTKPSVRILVTSCVKSVDVEAFREEIQDVIQKSSRGYPMPEKYSLVLGELLRMRAATAAADTDVRLRQTYVDVEELIKNLVKRVKKASDPHEATDLYDIVLQLTGRQDIKPYLDEATCRVILHTLHELGDLLWYDNIGDDILKSKIILDPKLMLDLVREVFNHKRTAEVMTHHTLKGLDLWRHLEGTDGMLAMKRVLQHFQLVFPVTGEMAADSDLIVPAYWQSNTCAFWMFGGGDLRFGRGIHREDVAVRVHWEFHFVNNYPHTLFDHLVVASYSPYYERDVGPDWLMYKEQDKGACRLMLARDVTTHHHVLHLEALQGHTASADHVEYLWDCFLTLAEALEKVIRGFPGVEVTRYAQEDTETDGEKKRYTLESLRGFRLSVRSRKWMPPQRTWEEYVALYKGRGRSLETPY